MVACRRILSTGFGFVRSFFAHLGTFMEPLSRSMARILTFLDLTLYRFLAALRYVWYNSMRLGKIQAVVAI